MYTLEKTGRIIFAIGIIALGILQFDAGDYIIGRPPPLLWPEWAAAMQGKLVWACFSASILLISGIAILINKKGAFSAIVVGVLILVYSFLFRHLPAMTDWLNSYKSLALGGGAFIVAVSIFKKNDAGTISFFTSYNLLVAGTIFLSLFLIACGIAHLKFHEFVENFIPDYIPARSFWTYLTATALLAGGTGLIFTRTRKWAAGLSGLMILLWFFLLHIPRTVHALHIPRTVHAPKDYSEWMGLFESFTLSGIFFTLAGLCSNGKFPGNPATGEGISK